MYRSVAADGRVFRMRSLAEIKVESAMMLTAEDT